MVPKLISKSVTGILILLVMAAMVWQVAPVSAGVTPTATATSIPPTATATSIPPTATATSIPSTATATSIRPTAIRPTSVPPTSVAPTATPLSLTATPTATLPLLLPITGGLASGPNNSEISAVSLAGVLVLLLVAISLVIRKSARTKSG